MASTTFVDGETLIEASWLNDVNAVVYTPGTQTAADIANVPAGSIAATDVQAALNELDTEKQPLDATLTAVAALDTTAGLVEQTGADAFTKTPITAFAKTLLDDADAATARATLGTSDAGMRNLLINGNFQFNQRGYVSGTNVGAANTYTLDRWRVVTSGQNVTFTASGNGYQITAPAGGIEQVIEDINIGGGTYVLNWTGTATATVNGTARAKGESFTLPANTNATVRLIGGTASQVQLEPGTVPTPFEHRPIGFESALCQRYYLNMGGEILSPCGTAGSGQPVTPVWYPFPVRMHASPTIDVPASGGINISSATATASALGIAAKISITSAGYGYADFTFNNASAEL